MKILSALTFFTALLVSFNTVAHTDEYLDTQTAPHGGQLRMVGMLHLELVVTDKLLTVYVTDHAGKPVAINGATSNAVILANKAKVNVELKPTGDNVLKGEGEFTLDPEMKVVVSITLADEKEPQQARFTPLEKPKEK
jgi:nitrogen fixation protein FixH